MRMFPINVEIELQVGAMNFEEAVEVVRRGLDEGRYTKEAKIYFDASAVNKYGRIKQCAHGDELEKPKRSNKPQKCILFMNTARGRAATPLQCKSIAEAVRIARESDLYFAYRVMVGYRVVRRGYCGGGK